jgi:hypothetical protein
MAVLSQGVKRRLHALLKKLEVFALAAGAERGQQFASLAGSVVKRMGVADRNGDALTGGADAVAQNVGKGRQTPRTPAVREFGFLYGSLS